MLPLPGTWHKKRANSRANAAQGLLCRFRDPTKFTAESVMFCCIPLRDTTTRCRKRPFKGPSSRCRTKSVLPEPVSPTKIVEWAPSRYRLVDPSRQPISSYLAHISNRKYTALPRYTALSRSSLERLKGYTVKGSSLCASLVSYSMLLW